MSYRLRCLHHQRVVVGRSILVRQLTLADRVDLRTCRGIGNDLDLLGAGVTQRLVLGILSVLLHLRLLMLVHCDHGGSAYVGHLKGLLLQLDLVVVAVMTLLSLMHADALTLDRVLVKSACPHGVVVGLLELLLLLNE
jgi:hypothetical protein